MIRALNGLRRDLGLPTMPTITGTRRASRRCRKRWEMALFHARLGQMVSGTMERYRNLMAVDDIGGPDAQQRGRLARMTEGREPMKWLRNILRRLALWLRMAGLLAATSKADTDTMGQWKRLQALPDDPGPRYVHPPAGPYADLIRRVRIYAQNGAKALAPLLDRPLPNPNYVDEDGQQTDADAEIVEMVMAAESAARAAQDGYAVSLLNDWRHPRDGTWRPDVLRAIHAAYNSPWTIVNGEPMEVVYSRAHDPASEVMQ